MRHVLLILFLLHSAWTLAQQTGTLTGTVRDEYGNTLPRANVSIVGTTTGVACDDHGRFTLTIPAGQGVTLRWTYSGMHAHEAQVMVDAGRTVTYDIFLKVTTLGTGRFSRNTDLGQSVPTIRAGSAVQIKTRAGVLIVSGSF